MEQKNYLIDTNAAIYYFGTNLSLKSDKFLDHVLTGNYAISIINWIELLGFAKLSQQETVTFETFIDNATQYDMDEAIVLQTIQIRKEYKTKLPDAIIAATCLIYNLTLVSNNIKDFQQIKGLDLVKLNIKPYHGK